MRLVGYGRLTRFKREKGDQFDTVHGHDIKNMTMESVSKMKEADEKYKKIIFTPDVNAEDRLEYKRLAEAKDEVKYEISGEFIYRVKGAPGSFRVIKIRKRY